MSTKPIIDFFTRVKELIKMIKEKLLKEGAHIEPENRLIRRVFYLFEIVTIFAMISCLILLVKCSN